MKNYIEIYFPIFLDYHSIGNVEDYPFGQKNIIINEIKNVIQAGFNDIDSNVNILSTNLTIEKNNIFLDFTGEEILKFEIKVEINPDAYKLVDEVGNVHSSKGEDNAPFFLAHLFGDRIFEILILSQIARPGSLMLKEGKVFVNGKLQWKTIPYTMSLREALEFQKERSYPEIQFLEFEPYYEWIIKNDLSFKVNPINSYQKALNNLSYINLYENRVESLVYQMRILEEVYTEGINEIAKQLNTKIQLFLGELVTFKGQIKTMYNVRSRFMHGDNKSSIAPIHKTDYDDYIFDESYEKKIEEITLFSQLLIISTLQKMYLKNFLEINFELKIVEHKISE